MRSEGCALDSQPRRSPPVILRRPGSSIQIAAGRHPKGQTSVEGKASSSLAPGAPEEFRGPNFFGARAARYFNPASPGEIPRRETRYPRSTEGGVRSTSVPSGQRMRSASIRAAPPSPKWSGTYDPDA